MKTSAMPFHYSILAYVMQLNVVDTLIRALSDLVKKWSAFDVHFEHCSLPCDLSHDSFTRSVCSTLSKIARINYASL